MPAVGQGIPHHPHADILLMYAEGSEQPDHDAHRSGRPDPYAVADVQERSATLSTRCVTAPPWAFRTASWQSAQTVQDLLSVKGAYDRASA